ncbi:hypothetical protein FHR34_007595 [Kitasatospora kifunensis]|uniref:Uncharacterized protein n=1 Tax=Kitasatospora kifunensis TaxID=58351 RepID=A0A7W7VZV1_KITKI|nr:hypothetical protein [Kitasatospora kifunensis]
MPRQVAASGNLNWPPTAAVDAGVGRSYATTRSGPGPRLRGERRMTAPEAQAACRRWWRAVARDVRGRSGGCVNRWSDGCTGRCSAVAGEVAVPSTRVPEPVQVRSYGQADWRRRRLYPRNSRGVEASRLPPLAGRRRARSTESCPTSRHHPPAVSAGGSQADLAQPVVVARSASSRMRARAASRKPCGSCGRRSAGATLPGAALAVQEELSAVLAAALSVVRSPAQHYRDPPHPRSGSGRPVCRTLARGRPVRLRIP